MSHIFRLYTNGPDTYRDWHGMDAFPYNHSNRQNIQDPEGDSAKVDITSIPSPFARIDVAKNAFNEVNRQGLDGDTIFHKTVSDILDVGEIFFNYEKLSQIIEIITWHPQNVQALKEQKQSDGNRFLGMAYDTYMASDQDSYNFDFNQNIYILNYKGGQNMMDVIGATSPATLFFSSANDLSFLAKEISFGQDHPFDKDYNPLYNRDFEYIKAWFIMRKLIPGFAQRLPEVDKYLDKTLSMIKDSDKRDELRNLTAADATQFSNINIISNGQADVVEIFGQPLLMKIVKKVETSEFQIVPTKEVAVKPLVLPVDSGNTYKDFLYTQEEWGTEAHAPFFDNTPISQRRLPFDGRQQEYLTISDFLEDYIVKVPHKMNKKDFFNPITFSIQENHEEISYLLPLKEKFFEYFDISDLKDSASTNSVGIIIDKLAADSVQVTLRIPVIGHGRLKTINYVRRYSGEPDIKRNKGGIETFDFDAFVMPLVRDKDESRAFYTVGCISTQSRNYRFKFFKGKSVVENELVTRNCRNQNSQQAYKSNTYTVRKTNFDYIQVVNEDNVQGLIIPKFKLNSSAITYNVAIDVGTSNTHIEYSKDNSTISESFAFNGQSALLSPVFIPTVSEIAGSERSIGLQEEYELILRDFMPKAIGDKEVYNFPTRTVLSCAKTFNPSQNNLPYELYNLSFVFDKIVNFDYKRDFCNIKWGKDDTLLKSFIDCVMLMVRNRILVGDGDLAKTKITWFFPTSMPMKRKNVLKRAWDDVYEKYFGTGLTQSMTESSAPIRFLFDTQDTSTDVVSIDIGGGTTDVAFAKNKQVLGVTSFRFASNSLFENQLAPSNHNNGIVDYFKNVLLDNIQNNGMYDIMKPLFDAETHQEPANMASFLFSLKDNSLLKNLNKEGIDFNLILNKDENFKIVFIIFYTAILYHIGKIIKYKDFNLPRHISFSGNGSKILNVISTNTIDLAEYTKLVLELVTGKKYKTRLELVGLGKDDNPKTSTCKGGLRSDASTLQSDPSVILCANGSAEIDEELTLETLKDNVDYHSSIVASVKEFFDFVLNKLPKVHKYNFDDHFGVTQSSIYIARSLMNEDLDTFLEKNIDIMIDEGDPKDKVEETMFFAPIKGVINIISKSIYESLL